MLVFGPVPSRRLGRSLGINNIPDKVCSYACVYCQIGKTLRMEVDRKKFYEPEKIYREVEKRLNENMDYITFVPDGEPTLDLNLGKTASLLEDFGVPLAIITNASLITREDVREDIMAFDYISFKLDAVSEELWRKINRPHKSLNLSEILQALLDFRNNFRGKIVTETMMIDGIDYYSEIPRIGRFVSKLKPDVAYIAVPTRPPAERWVKPPKEDVLAIAYDEFSKYVKTEYLIGYEGNEFSTTGNFEDDILSITAVHPMREEAVLSLLERCKEDISALTRLVEDGKIIVVEYGGNRYYMRALPSREHMRYL